MGVHSIIMDRYPIIPQKTKGDVLIAECLPLCIFDFTLLTALRELLKIDYVLICVAHRPFHSERYRCIQCNQ